MSLCPHPESAVHNDPARGRYCTLCGHVIDDTQFELDPIFEGGGSGASRGARMGGAGNRGTAAGSLRNLGGSLRPTRSADGSLAPMVYNPRATIEQARKEMMNTARSLEIDPDTVEIALGIYTLALRNHIISGTRSVVLRACLYAACRRQKTTHIIYDFVEPNGDSAHSILTHMKLVCEGTRTEVPVIDPSALIQRLAEQMDLGEHTHQVVVCALKVLRAMRDDWIACGRRPMGVCAAALLVGCYVFNIPRSPEQVCGMARLTSNTISKRLNEFSATPAAELDNIDDYRPSNATLPPAFNDSSRKSTEDDMGAEMRELSSLYYELVAEAKVSTPATEERCKKWRCFLEKHCELEHQEPNEANLDLRNLTPLDQLRILGLSHTTPIPYEVVEESVKREEDKIAKKVDRGSSATPFAVDFYHHPHNLSQNSYYGTNTNSGGAGILGQPNMMDLSDPDQLHEATNRYRELLENNAEVRGLHEEFDFDDDGDQGRDEFDLGGAQGGGTGGRGFANDDFLHSSLAPTQMGSSFADVKPSPSPAPHAHSWHAGGDSTKDDDPQERNAAKILLETIMRDKERRHALPWEFLVLQDAAQEDATDLLGYLVLDNEERVRREKIGLAMYKGEWERGRPRTREEIQQLEENRLAKRRRQQITQEEPVEVTMARTLHGQGASTVNLGNLAELLPQLSGVEDAVQDEDWSQQLE